jgi:small subunit ribosomal protein S20
MAKFKTGRHTSALKETRKAKKRMKRNVIIKSMIKTLIKKVEIAVKNNDEAVQSYLSAAFSRLDRAAKNNIVHYNMASNQKARLSKLVAGRVQKN